MPKKNDDSKKKPSDLFNDLTLKKMVRRIKLSFVQLKTSDNQMVVLEDTHVPLSPWKQRAIVGQVNEDEAMERFPAKSLR